MVTREVAVPAALGFLVYTFLLMMRGIFALVEQIFVRGVSAADGLGLLVCSLPHVAVLTLPMGYLFGVLIAMGRMTADNEITALQAVGVSARRLVRPVLLLGVALAMMNGYLTLWVMPIADRTLRELRTSVFSSARALGRIEPRVFHEGFANVLLYVQDVDPGTGEWRKVMLYDRSEPGVERLTLAQRGQLLAGGASAGGQGKGGSPGAEEEPWLELQDVVTHQFMPGKPATYRVNQNRSQVHRLSFPDQGQTRYRPGIRERSSAELLKQVGREARDENEARDRRQARVEIHKRLAIPCACVAFALLALPLGVGSRSGGRGRGFILSIGVILVYYVVFNNGELLALEGRVPAWLGVWFPNLLLSAIALFLMQRMGRWLGERQTRVRWFDALTRGWGEWRERRRAAGARGRRSDGGLVGGRAPRRWMVSRFPTLLDGYLTRRLLAPIGLVLLSTSSLYIIVDLTDRVDEIAKHHSPAGIVLAYYWNLIPQVVLDVTPFALLIAVLIVLTVLERQRELTALKAAGVSVFRVMLPVVILAGAATAALWTLEESVVPAANREAKRLLDRIKGRETARSYQTTDRQWLLSRDGTTLYNFLRYDMATLSMARFTLFRIDGALRLRYHLSADRLHYENGSWFADSGWYRQFFPDGSDEYRMIVQPLKIDIPEGPEYFGQEYRLPAEMSYRELGAYIREVVSSGYRPHKLVVRWHQKLTYPLAAFVMVSLALPYGLSRGGRRVTTMQGIALALGLGIVYLVSVAVCGKMGEADLLPPAVAAWSPVALAFLFAVNRMTTIRS
jgi:LPS export ABC transporter permease LptG/LPS export ABC transporter permease LptF